MSVVTTRRCTGCKVNLEPAFYASPTSTVCRKCQRRNREQKRGVLEICCDEDHYHVRGVFAKRAVCGATVKPAPYANVPGALLALRDDVACCERCRERLGEVFG